MLQLVYLISYKANHHTPYKHLTYNRNGRNQNRASIPQTPGITSCWQTMTETRQINLADSIQLLLKAEKDSRSANRVNRLIHNSSFPYTALVEEIEPDPARGIDPTLLNQPLNMDNFQRKGEEGGKSMIPSGRIISGGPATPRIGPQPMAKRATEDKITNGI